MDRDHPERELTRHIFTRLRGSFRLPTKMSSLGDSSHSVCAPSQVDAVSTESSLSAQACPVPLPTGRTRIATVSTQPANDLCLFCPVRLSSGALTPSILSPQTDPLMAAPSSPPPVSSHPDLRSVPARGFQLPPDPPGPTETSLQLQMGQPTASGPPSLEHPSSVSRTTTRTTRTTQTTRLTSPAPWALHPTCPRRSRLCE